MKRNHLMLVVLVCFVGAMILPGCSDSPEDVIKDVKEKVAAGDLEGARERLNDLDMDELEGDLKKEAEALKKTDDAGKGLGDALKKATGG